MPQTEAKTDAISNALTVFFDGACPLCDREIAFYRRRRGADAIQWVDVSGAAEGDVAPGLSRDAALARFHVLECNGTLTSGGRAFAALWTRLPGFRPLGLLFQLRPLGWILDRAYALFLKVRPRLQALASKRQPTLQPALPDWLVSELRSDQAGETGAVTIYRGILAVSRDPEIRRFAEAHLTTEQRHLALLDATLPPAAASLFLPLWRVAGFLTGALPALFGPRAVFATIDAVETFVDKHYAEQVDRLTKDGTNPEIRMLLERCRLDEVEHRDEARDLLARPPGLPLRAWCWMVGAGSAAAVEVARRI